MLGSGVGEMMSRRGLFGGGPCARPKDRSLFPLGHVCANTIGSLFLEVRMSKYGNGVATPANPEHRASMTRGLSASTRVSTQACREWRSLGTDTCFRARRPCGGLSMEPVSLLAFRTLRAEASVDSGFSSGDFYVSPSCPGLVCPGQPTLLPQCPL